MPYNKFPAVDGTNNFPAPVRAAMALYTELIAAFASKSVETTVAQKADTTALTAHTGNVANPHSVTKAQIGLGSVDNTSDIGKPVSTLQQTELDKLAKGVVVQNDVSANTGAIGSAAIVYNIPTFTFKANRWYVIEWDTGMYGTVGDQYPQLLIGSCAVGDAAGLTTGITTLMNRTTNLRIAGNSEGFRITRRIKYGVDTTVQIKFQALVAAGGGTFIISGATQNVVQYSITDQGMSGA